MAAVRLLRLIGDVLFKMLAFLQTSRLFIQHTFYREQTRFRYFRTLPGGKNTCSLIFLLQRRLENIHTEEGGLSMKRSVVKEGRKTDEMISS